MMPCVSVRNANGMDIILIAYSEELIHELYGEYDFLRPPHLS